MRKSPEKDEDDRVLLAGKPDYERCDNKICTSKYTLLSFLPVAVLEQFRRTANLYFLIMSCLMALGAYTSLFDTSMTPWTTAGPLMLMIAVSLAQEGSADMGRHRADEVCNSHPCTVLRRADDLENDKDAQRDKAMKDISVNLRTPYFLSSQPSTERSDRADTTIAFETVKRMDIRQGHFVLIKNKDQVPADLVLIASSSDNGSAYIETSSIDGETNLKLRSSPTIPKEVLDSLNFKNGPNSSDDDDDESDNFDENDHVKRETLSQAVRRICRQSILGFPDGIGAVHNPKNEQYLPREEASRLTPRQRLESIKKQVSTKYGFTTEPTAPVNPHYITALRSESPNASINTFNGTLVLPPLEAGGKSIDVPLGTDNMLLRGAVLMNTRWAIGIACYTGDDSKLVMNSFETPSKFSQLDKIVNVLVVAILCLAGIIIAFLATFNQIANDEFFDELWYIGYNKNTTELWPYLPPDKFTDPPKWVKNGPNWIQIYLTFITQMSGIIPLSLYVSIEMIVVVMRILINRDVKMYDPYTDTPAIARSTTVSDLGQVKYIFSDKTGTLTQNVMKFKRCSVDGQVFGAPIKKSTPGAEIEAPTQYNALQQLLVGNSSKLSTFNGEMFLRVMSLCHTVVIEKADEAAKPPGLSTHPESIRKSTKGEVEDDEEMQAENSGKSTKGKGGAPWGFDYQAESPDESALVEASSVHFDYQVVGRDSSGITLSCSSRSILSDESVVECVKNGSLSNDELAANTSSPQGKLGLQSTESFGPREEKWEILAVNKFDSTRKRMSVIARSPPELGSIPMLLCKGADTAMIDPDVVENPSFFVKGDEDNKAIIDLGRSEDSTEWKKFGRDSNLSLQTHLGEFAKEGLRTLVLGVRILSEDEYSEWLAKYKTAASSIKDREALLTEVALDIEKKLHIVGATAIEDKLQDGVPDTIEMMGKAGIKLWVLTGDKRETAIEIGYSANVLTEKMRPGMIEIVKTTDDEVRTKMAMAFLKLVKYAKIPEYQRSAIDEHTPKPLEKIAFKYGKFKRRINRAIRRFFHSRLKVCFLSFLSLFCKSKEEENKGEDPKILLLNEEEEKEKIILQLSQRRRLVRRRAEKILRDYLKTPEGMEASERAKERAACVVASASSKKSSAVVEDVAEDLADDVELSLRSEPDVFDKAGSARHLLQEIHYRRASLDHTTLSTTPEANLTAKNVAVHDDTKPHEFECLIVDEEILSMKSMIPSAGEEHLKYDKRKRTALEAIFSADKSVRHGQLGKHLSDEYVQTLSRRAAGEEVDVEPSNESADGPRALIIEGSALESLLGDAELEELLFAVANTCDSVIACRVSPAQKAQLVQLVRRYVLPEPVTLAIGDGANDVGMIQEAHVGVGISGKEGQQAVNSSDFAIAQFRFLQGLTLIHGRWNFLRLSKVILFSFYKNGVMAGCLVAFDRYALWSGSLIFAEVNLFLFTFITFCPILLLGMFDRELDQDYVLKNPDVYTPTRRNEILKKRSILRWLLIYVIHQYVLFFFSVPALAPGGAGTTSAFLGMMKGRNPEQPGDGEGGDLRTVGFVLYTNLFILLTCKVLLESKSIINGEFPCCTCSNKNSEGWPNRLPYTWIGVVILAIAVFVGFEYLFQILGRYVSYKILPSFLSVVYHAWQTRLRSWMVIFLAPTFALVVDIFFKNFSNMFYPSQSQIHLEIFAKKKQKKE